MIDISNRAKSIKPSATLAVMAKAKELKSKGVDIINFGPGEPDFDTPEHIKDAGINAINSNFTRYTASTGIIELKEAVCNKLLLENNLKYATSQITISTGAKQALYNAVMAICNPGDEIIVPYPCWVSYTYMIKMAGGVPVYIYTSEEDGFRIDFDLLKSRITDKTKAIMINTPNNPTGCVFTKEDLEQIAELALKHKFYILADEIYEKLVYDDAKHYSVGSFSDAIKDLTITINGVSKSYAMTGWRIGYVAANLEISKAIGKIQDHSTSCTNAIAQKAAVTALTGTQKPIKDMIEAFEKRRNVMYEKLNEIPLMSCRKPQGAFYIMGNISKFIGKSYEGRLIDNSQICAQLLLEKSKVAVTPGSGFGPEWESEQLDNFVRMSYATSMDDIVEGAKRIRQFSEKLV